MTADPMAAVPVVPIDKSPEITTGLKFDPSPIRAAPEVLVAIVKSSPEIVRSPAIVTLAPLIVKAVVGVDPDLTKSSPPDCVRLPKVVPSSFNKTSAPPASNIRSPGVSKVTLVAPFKTKSNTDVPAALRVILSPSASRIISPDTSNV
jgi:hypothetical protein